MISPQPKRWKFEDYDWDIADELQAALKIHPVFCQLLAQRNVSNFEEAKAFFRPNWEQLHDPFLMKGMMTAVRRIEKAIIRKEKILIYGDYDVDGTTSAALMFDFLSKYCDKLHYYIPDRYKEGYGISMQSIEYAEQNRFGLIIALDCGIKAHQQIQAAQEKGIDFIVCDHHLPDEQLPPAVAILNPKQTDCSYPYKELSGCAIGFKLAQAFSMNNDLPQEDIEALLDLVVVSLACDIVPLTGENRTLSFLGLKQFNEQPRVSLKAFQELLERPLPYSVRDIVFGIGPIINAAGRMEHAKAAVQMLLAPTAEVAKNQAKELFKANQERREVEAQITEEAIAQVEAMEDFDTQKSIVVYQPHWHKGVVGIVAARLVERYNKPSIVLTASEGKVAGSARTSGDFNIHDAIHACEDLLVNFGGHHHAAGLTLMPDKVEAFQQQFEEVVQGSIKSKDLKPTQRIDAELNMKDIQPKFWKILQQFAPFGPANMRPVFTSKMVKDTGYSKTVGKDKQHLKLRVRQGDSPPVDGIGFGFGVFFDKIKTRKPFHVCYAIGENTFKGETKLQIEVKDIRF